MAGRATTGSHQHDGSLGHIPNPNLAEPKQIASGNDEMSVERNGCDNPQKETRTQVNSTSLELVEDGSHGSDAENRTAKRIKITDSNCVENDSHGSSSVSDLMKRIADLRISPLLKVIITAENNSFKEYHEEAEIQPSWRPPISIEDGIWVPIRVETNGEGRERLRWYGGDFLVEVFDIKVDLRGTPRRYGNIHGNITLDCMAYAISLFDCDTRSAVLIQEKSFDVAPLGYDPIGFILTLKIDDDEFCEDVLVRYPRIDWNQ